MSSILGYKTLNEEQVSLVNAIKLSEEAIIELIDDIILEKKGNRQWSDVAKIDIQKGFMSLIRAVTRPE